MTEFIRPIHQRIEDLFIFDIEAQCNLADHLKHYISDSLGESEFHATLGCILEESDHRLILGEPSGGREQVVLHGYDGGHCNLSYDDRKLLLCHLHRLKMQHS